MSEPTIVQLLHRLTPDRVRTDRPFTLEMASANEALLRANSDSEVIAELRKWIRLHQPCIFGRMAAGRADLISFCILTERDLAQPDSVIREKIQKCRLQWRRAAYLGSKSAFVVLALSPQILKAAPDQALLDLAVRLAELYLLERVRADAVYHDRISLEIAADHHREWVVGANFFGAQADGRWWHDHRMPGGIALSMNSVGHMIRSGAERNERAELLAEAAAESGRGNQKLPIDSLNSGLRYAMVSISRAADTVSGRSSCLRSMPATGEVPVQCPLTPPIPAELRDKDWTTYLGWYDTDVTVPTAFFRPDIERPASLQQLELDLSYLFDDRDLDYYRTGPGVQTR